MQLCGCDEERALDMRVAGLLRYQDEYLKLLLEA